MVTNAEFELKIHEEERVLEVVYPARPTRQALARYEAAVKKAAQSLGQGWKCLVDQRALVVVTAEVADEVRELNVWAAEHGMSRCARVVNPQSPISQMQASRILREAGIDAETAVFQSRAEAWAALLLN